MTTSHSIQRFSLAACAAAILVFGTGCSSTTDLLVKMRLINAKPYENTQEARDTHRDNCMANYGLENLRFTEPVCIGDTIQVRLTAKEKIRKAKRPEEDRATGVVVWDAEITNQDDVTVAVYDILTLVERADD